jgi:hypothetical protein
LCARHRAGNVAVDRTGQGVPAFDELQAKATETEILGVKVAV